MNYRGFIPEESIVETYNSLDILILTSDWEGFGMPILEAQSCGIPVIITEEARISEEVSRYCVKAKTPEDIADKIYEITQNSNLKKQIVDKGIDYARHFSWEKTIDATLKLYQEMV